MRCRQIPGKDTVTDTSAITRLKADLEVILGTTARQAQRSARKLPCNFGIDLHNLGLRRFASLRRRE